MKNFSITIKLICIFTIFTVPLTARKVVCLNERQDEVDWFIAIRINGPVSPRRYAIMDSKLRKWRETTEVELLKPIFTQIKAIDDMVISWNDEPPKEVRPGDMYAHAKGFIAFNRESETGFYFMHSIPKYPWIDKITGDVDFVSPKSSYYG